MDEVDLWLAAAGISTAVSVAARERGGAGHSAGGKQALVHRGQHRGGVGHDAAAARPDAASISGSGPADVQAVQGGDALLRALKRGKKRKGESGGSGDGGRLEGGAEEEEESRAAVYGSATGGGAKKGGATPLPTGHAHVAGQQQGGPRPSKKQRR